MPGRVPLLAFALFAACSQPKERAGDTAQCAGMMIEPQEVTLVPRQTANFVVSTSEGTTPTADLDFTLQPALGAITADGGFTAPPQLGNIQVRVTYWKLPDSSGAYTRPSTGKHYMVACYAAATVHVVPESDGGIDAGDASDSSSDGDADDASSDAAIDASDATDGD